LLTNILVCRSLRSLTAVVANVQVWHVISVSPVSRKWENVGFHSIPFHFHETSLAIFMPTEFPLHPLKFPI